MAAMGKRTTERHGERGFTLIELMVVIVIIGLAAAVVVLSMPETGGSVRAEAERFAARAKAARDSAVIESRPYAVRVGPGGYMVSKRVRGEWREHAAYEWSQGIEAEASGTTPGLTRFDSTGLAEPFYLTLRRRGQRVAVEIGHDGGVNVRR